jgi:hypothetical protein
VAINPSSFEVRHCCGKKLKDCLSQLSMSYFSIE